MKFSKKLVIIGEGLAALASSPVYSQDKTLETVATEYNAGVIWVDEGTPLYQVASTLERDEKKLAVADNIIHKDELIKTYLCDNWQLRQNISQLNNNIADLTANLAHEVPGYEALEAAMRLDSVMVKLANGTTCEANPIYVITNQKDGLRGDGFVTIHAQNVMVPVVVPNKYLPQSNGDKISPDNSEKIPELNQYSPQSNGDKISPDNSEKIPELNQYSPQSNGDEISLDNSEKIPDANNRNEASLGNNGNNTNSSVNQIPNIDIQNINRNILDCITDGGTSSSSENIEESPKVEQTKDGIKVININVNNIKCTSGFPSEVPISYDAHTGDKLGLGAHYIFEGGQAPLSGYGGWLEGRLEILASKTGAIALDVDHLWASWLTYNDNKENKVFVLDGDVNAGYVFPVAQGVRLELGVNGDFRTADVVYSGFSIYNGNFAVGPELTALLESGRTHFTIRGSNGFGNTTTTVDIPGYKATKDTTKKTKLGLEAGYRPVDALGFRVLGYVESDRVTATLQDGAQLPQDHTNYILGGRVDVLDWATMGADYVRSVGEDGPNDTNIVRIIGGVYHKF